MVWEYYEHGGSEKLVMLSLADEANHEGRFIYPSVDRIAARTGISSRQVRRILRDIETRVVGDVNWLILVGGGRGGHKVTRRYRIPVAELQEALSRETRTSCPGSSEDLPGQDDRAVDKEGGQDDRVSTNNPDKSDIYPDVSVRGPVIPVRENIQGAREVHPVDNSNGQQRPPSTAPPPIITGELLDYDWQPPQWVRDRCAISACPTITQEHITGFIANQRKKRLPPDQADDGFIQYMITARVMRQERKAREEHNDGQARTPARPESAAQRHARATAGAFEDDG